MKKTLLTLAALSIFAGFAGFSNQAVISAPVERGYITVNTSANTEAAPDVAEISFAVRTSDVKSMQKATQMNKEISDRLHSVLGSMLNVQNGDYIKTSDFNASPVYTYSGSKKNLDRYEVSNRVIIHTKSIDKVGTMIDKAIDAGATNVDNLTFSVSNYDAQCNDLLNIAAKKAYTRANLLSKSVSATLDGVRTFDASCNANNNYNTPRMYMAKNMLSATADSIEAASGAPTAITGGVIKIYANVNASFFVK